MCSTLRKCLTLPPKPAIKTANQLQGHTCSCKPAPKCWMGIWKACSADGIRTFILNPSLPRIVDALLVHVTACSAYAGTWIWSRAQSALYAAWPVYGRKLPRPTGKFSEAAKHARPTAIAVVQPANEGRAFSHPFPVAVLELHERLGPERCEAH